MPRLSNEEVWEEWGVQARRGRHRVASGRARRFSPAEGTGAEQKARGVALPRLGPFPFDAPTSPRIGLTARSTPAAAAARRAPTAGRPPDAAGRETTPATE